MGYQHLQLTTPEELDMKYTDTTLVDDLIERKVLRPWDLLRTYNV